MSKVQLARWLKDAQKGIFNIPQLEQLDFPKAITATFLIVSLQVVRAHSLDHFFEVGFAETQEAAKEKGKTDQQSIHTYVHCVFLTSDSGALTGVTFLGRIHCRPSPNKNGSFELASSSSVSVFKSPDGWVVKSLEEKTISLDEQVMTKRGWLFGAK